MQLDKGFYLPSTSNKTARLQVTNLSFVLPLPAKRLYVFTGQLTQLLLVHRHGSTHAVEMWLQALEHQG